MSTSPVSVVGSPPLALQALDLVAAGRRLSLSAPPGTLTFWNGDDAVGTAELSLALAGRFHPVTGRVLVLDRNADAATLRREVVVARVVESVEAEPRLRLGEYLASCAALHGSHHNRLGAEAALADVGLAESSASRPLEQLSPADQVRACVAGALLSRPVAVVLDRADRGVGSADWPGLVADLHHAAEATGAAIIASVLRGTEVAA